MESHTETRQSWPTGKDTHQLDADTEAVQKIYQGLRIIGQKESGNCVF